MTNMTKYFLYSDEQIKEKNAILARSDKEFVPGIVTMNGKKVKYSQLSDTAAMPRFVDTKVIASGELNDFTYTLPQTVPKRGS